MFFLDKTGVTHERVVYTLIDALGDIGGIIEIIMILLGILLLPISKHSFYLKASN